MCHGFCFYKEQRLVYSENITHLMSSLKTKRCLYNYLPTCYGMDLWYVPMLSVITPLLNPTRLVKVQTSFTSSSHLVANPFVFCSSTSRFSHTNYSSSDRSSGSWEEGRGVQLVCDNRLDVQIITEKDDTLRHS